MITARQFEGMMDEIAPLRYSYDWDNSGMTILTHPAVERVLICLDVTEQVIAEAVEKGCDTILSHHPLIFKGIKKLRQDQPVQTLCIQAIQAGLNLYAAHTSYDCAPLGINYSRMQALGLEKGALLAEEGRDHCYKVVVYVPAGEREAVRRALFEAGAGSFGNYEEVSYEMEGRGRFTPTAQAHPAIGAAGRPETVEETRVEVLCREQALAAVVQAAREAHPYEEPVIDVYRLERPCEPYGIGMLGELPQAMEAEAFARYVKERLGAASVKTGGAMGPVKRVACVGGAAGEYFALAKKQGADAFVVGEAKYNHFLDARDCGILLVEAGHYDTEKTFVEAMKEGLQNYCNRVQYNIAVIASEYGSRPYSVY